MICGDILGREGGGRKGEGCTILPVIDSLHHALITSCILLSI